MAKRKRDRVLAQAAGLAASVATRLRKRRGIVGRVARALDDELQLTYAAQCAKYEDDLIDRVVGHQPVPEDLKVSIVLPTYDVPLPYAKELVESIEGQTYKSWELCICDDADPRVDVRNWLEGLARERPERFRMTRHTENRGISEATRSAVGLVTGDLVAFVDEDDLLHRRALEAVVSRFAADDEVDLVYTDNDRATDLGFRHGPVRKPGWSPELLQSVNYINHLAVVRRTCMDRCEGLFGEGLSGSQDWDLCYKLVPKVRKVAHVPLPLYHWRTRPGSIAAHAYAKPWAHEAGLRARLRHVQTIDDRLCVEPEDSRFRYHYEPALRQDAEVPPLTVVEVGAGKRKEARGELFGYPGWSRTVPLPVPGVKTNGDCLQRIRELSRTVDRGLVFFIDEARPLPAGKLSKMVAFAIQPAVGAVWPFRGEEARLCYTTHQYGDRLAPIQGKPNIYARFSGNVLTGPLHGMLLGKESLSIALDALLDLGETGFDFLDRELVLDAVGASMGLALLAAGKRNVGCRGMMCAVDLQVVYPPRSLIPARDPYV